MSSLMCYIGPILMTFAAIFAFKYPKYKKVLIGWQIACMISR
jgi:hypothetical protein